MSNIKIFIFAYKEGSLPKHPYFLPVQGGAALHDHILGYQPDNNGDKISIKKRISANLHATIGLMNDLIFKKHR